MTDRQPTDRAGRFGAVPHAESDITLEPEAPTEDLPQELLTVLESAARLQQAVPDAVLVGGTVSAVYAGHRMSYDHDHVLDLSQRYEAVLDAVEATDGWATSVRASKPPMTIMGSLGGVEAGLRQLRRTVPLQTQRLVLPDGSEVTVPTIEEALRVKAYLAVSRNQVRDFLDVAALADRMGVPAAAAVLADIDRYYVDRSGHPESVRSEVVVRLAKPEPKDSRVISELSRYKGLVPRWHDWEQVRRALSDVAQAMLNEQAGERR